MLLLSTHAYNEIVPAAKPYHHGNLRVALLDAAIHLIAEVGPAGFTLREVARRAGVSHNAPYRHFRDRDDLMAAVAEQGFRELTQAMLGGAGSDARARDRLKQAGLAYVRFALRRPQHFAIMFDAPNFTTGKHPDSADASARAFGTLVNFVEAAQEEESLPRGDTQQLALFAWCTVHGIAKLAIAGRLPFHTKAEIFHFAGYVIDHSLPSGTKA
jgi:AcrR family transcriptional regulator